MHVYSERTKSLMSQGADVGITYFRAGFPFTKCATRLRTVLSSELIKIHSTEPLL